MYGNDPVPQKLPGGIRGNQPLPTDRALRAAEKRGLMTLGWRRAGPGVVHVKVADRPPVPPSHRPGENQTFSLEKPVIRVMTVKLKPGGGLGVSERATNKRWRFLG